MLISRLGYVSVISLGLTLFIIALDKEYRPYSYISLVIFVISTYASFFLVKNRNDVFPISRKAAAIILCLAVSCGLQAWSSTQAGKSFAVVDIMKMYYSLFSFSAIYLSVKIWGREWYSEKLIQFLVVLSVLSIALYFSGFYLDSTNFYASILIIPVMYSLLVGKNYIFLFLLVCLLGLGAYFGARGAYVVIFIFLGMYLILKRTRIGPSYVFALISSLLVIQTVMLESNSLYFDELLSYRPTIWHYYFESTMDNKWFGNGQISDQASEGAASYYQYMISRGVGSSYGTQSMYLLYFYETGMIGILVLLGTMLLTFSTRSIYLIPVLAILTLAFMETVRIGSISVYGLPLSYFMVLSIIYYEEGNA